MKLAVRWCDGDHRELATFDNCRPEVIDGAVIVINNAVVGGAAVAGFSPGKWVNFYMTSDISPGDAKLR